MVTSELTEKLIEDGEMFLRKLDEKKYQVSAALWYFYPDERMWKLIISFPKVGSIGTKLAYTKIQKVLSKTKNIHALALEDISLVKSKSSLLEVLKVGVITGPGISGLRFSNNVINGHLISDAYIYRLY